MSSELVGDFETNFYKYFSLQVIDSVGAVPPNHQIFLVDWGLLFNINAASRWHLANDKTYI